MPSPKDFAKAFRVKPGTRAELAKRDPDNTLDWSKAGAADALQDKNVARIAERQKLLFAASRYSLLIILQGIDTSGKDGTIRHLLTGVNPQGVRVTGFGVPSKEELAHDYLWRIHAAVPARGLIGVFNRSHYESLLVERVHELAPEAAIKQRFDQINAFERHLVENNCIILKFMLHISKEEQRERLQDRLTDREKNWKMNPADLKERVLWNQYAQAYEDVVTKCSTPHAPWYVIPSDKKWFRNLVISQIVADTLDAMDMEYPKPSFDPKTVKVV